MDTTDTSVGRGRSTVFADLDLPDTDAYLLTAERDLGLPGCVTHSWDILALECEGVAPLPIAGRFAGQCRRDAPGDRR